MNLYRCLLILVSHLSPQKPSLLSDWVDGPHCYPSGQWHICQIWFHLEYWSGILNWQGPINNPTCDDYMLPISGRPSKVAQERTTREHLAGRSRKLVWDAHVNIPGPISAAILSVKDLHPLDIDSGAIVNGKPGWTFISWVAHVASPCVCLYWGCDCVSVNTLRWLIKALKPRWHPGCYRLKQLTCKDSVIFSIIYI